MLCRFNMKMEIQMNTQVLLNLNQGNLHFQSQMTSDLSICNTQELSPVQSGENKI